MSKKKNIDNSTNKVRKKIMKVEEDQQQPILPARPEPEKIPEPQKNPNKGKKLKSFSKMNDEELAEFADKVLKKFEGNPHFAIDPVSWEELKSHIAEYIEAVERHIAKGHQQDENETKIREYSKE